MFGSQDKLSALFNICKENKESKAEKIILIVSLTIINFLHNWNTENLT